MTSEQRRDALIRLPLFLLLLGVGNLLRAGEPIDVWPNLAPGESTRETGETLPYRESEVPPVTRVINIRRPTFVAFPADKPNGTGVVILPGGGFGKVVPDKEGSEAAKWLNKYGVTAFVLSYRTKLEKKDRGWHRPLQDAQRTLSLIRSQADKWHLKRDRIGLAGFSAGGQVAARLLTDGEQLAYKRIDAVDDVSHRPDFAMLVYPWNIYDSNRGALAKEIAVSKECPPTFLVHTDDDRSSSLGAVLFYAQLKRLRIPSELHVYGNGGHGYGLRQVEGSQISSWPDHAGHWLGTQGFLK
jgi:acetyl esterase/lipase